MFLLLALALLSTISYADAGATFFIPKRDLTGIESRQISHTLANGHELDSDHVYVLTTQNWESQTRSGGLKLESGDEGVGLLNLDANSKYLVEIYSLSTNTAVVGDSNEIRLSREAWEPLPQKFCAKLDPTNCEPSLKRVVATDESGVLRIRFKRNQQVLYFTGLSITLLGALTTEPSHAPTNAPLTISPTVAPSHHPSNDPTIASKPTNAPSFSPTLIGAQTTDVPSIITTPMVTSSDTTTSTDLPSFSPTNIGSITSAEPTKADVPVNVVQETWRFEGDYEEIIAGNEEKFKKEFDEKYYPLKCREVAKGSILVTVEGKASEVKETKAKIKRENLQLTSFSKLELNEVAETTLASGRKIKESDSSSTTMIIIIASAVGALLLLGVVMWVMCKANENKENTVSMTPRMDQLRTFDNTSQIQLQEMSPTPGQTAGGSQFPDLPDEDLVVYEVKRDPQHDNEYGYQDEIRMKRTPVAKYQLNGNIME